MTHRSTWMSAPSRPAIPMMPTTMGPTTSGSPMLFSMWHPRSVTLECLTTTPASVALPSGSLTPPVTVTSSSAQSVQPSKRIPYPAFV